MSEDVKDTITMRKDAARMEVLQSAIHWLEEYRRPDTAPQHLVDIKIDPTFAGSCYGAKEAQSLLVEDVHRNWRVVHERALFVARSELARLHAKWGMSE